VTDYGAQEDGSSLLTVDSGRSGGLDYDSLFRMWSKNLRRQVRMILVSGGNAQYVAQSMSIIVVSQHRKFAKSQIPLR